MFCGGVSHDFMTTFCYCFARRSRAGVIALAELATISHCDADLSPLALREKGWGSINSSFGWIDCTFYEGFVLRDDHYIDFGAAISNTNPTSTTTQRRPRLSVVPPTNSSMLTERREASRPPTPDASSIHHLGQPLMAQATPVGGPPPQDLEPALRSLSCLVPEQATPSKA